MCIRDRLYHVIHSSQSGGRGAPNLDSLYPHPAGRQTYPTMHAFKVVPIYLFPNGMWWLYGKWWVGDVWIRFRVRTWWPLNVGGNYRFFKFDSEGKIKKDHSFPLNMKFQRGYTMPRERVAFNAFRQRAPFSECRNTQQKKKKRKRKKNKKKTILIYTIIS